MRFRVRLVGALWYHRDFYRRYFPSWLSLGGLVLACLLIGMACNHASTRPSLPGASLKPFVSQNFFSISHPDDWSVRDLDAGANLFLAEEHLFVRLKIGEPASNGEGFASIEARIASDAKRLGATIETLEDGERAGHRFGSYLLIRGNGQKLREYIIYHRGLHLLYVLIGSSRSEDFAEFEPIFDHMVTSFQFRITARFPPDEAYPFEASTETIPGVWASFLEGLRKKDYGLLQRVSAKVLASRLANNSSVEDVRGDYFPHDSPVYTYVSHLEVRERLARAEITVRALPPDGFLRHETREFILEDGRWRLLRFERVE